MLKTNKKNMKVVITIGTGNSGCGAVHDFLIKSTKFKNPFVWHEFRMINDPDGILNLYNNFYKNCSINNSSNAVMRFKNYINNLINLEMKVNNKNNKIYSKKIISLADKYINNITTLNYAAYPQFISIQKNFFKQKISNLKKRVFRSKNDQDIFRMYLPVKENIFIKETKKFISKIIKYQLKNSNTDYIIFDQAFSIFNFINVFSYFDNAKVILVTRDPRGIYNSMKTRKSGAYPQTLKVWTEWFSQIMKKYYDYKKKIPKKFKKKILEIKFENFCQNYEKEQKKILKFLNVKKINNDFDISESKFNALKAKKQLSSFENKYIKKRLSKYLQWQV